MRNIGCCINQDFQRPPQSIVEAFRGIQVANLVDCMNRTAALSEKIRPVNSTKLLGTAFTVKVAQGDNLMLHKAMDLAKPGDVLVIDAGGMENRAIFGEIIASYCITREIAGIIVDGSIRDFETLSQMDLPIYAKGISPNGPYKNGPGEIGTIITVGGQIIRPGAILVGDADGVVSICHEDAVELLEKVNAIAEKEADLLETIRTKGQYERPWVDEILRVLGCEGINCS